MVPQLDRCNLLRAVGLGTACLCFPGSVFARGGATAKRTNLVVVLCDDLGYGGLSCYGHPHTKTPHLDRLASDGVKLADCYAAAPVCSPARAGIFAGRTPYRCAVYDWIPAGSPMHQPSMVVSVATLLRD